MVDYDIQIAKDRVSITLEDGVEIVVLGSIFMVVRNEHRQALGNIPASQWEIVESGQRVR